MEITCPSCSKRYRVEDSLIPEGGRNVKCRKCGHMFRVEKTTVEVVETDPPFELNLGGGTADSQLSQESEGSPAAGTEMPSPDGGTIRISKEQIEASLRGSGAQEMSMPDEDGGPGLQLDEDRAADVAATGIDINPAELPDQPVKHLEKLYRVRIEGKEYTGLTIDDIKQWIEEDRLLENDEVCRHGSVLWVKAEAIPEFKKLFSLHVYRQRKQFDEQDNPYLRFKEKEEKEEKRSGGGFMSKLKSLFQGR